MTEQQVQQKFTRLAEPVLGTDATSALRAAVSRLPGAPGLDDVVGAMTAVPDGGATHAA
jgi:hypothetical protein